MRVLFVSNYYPPHHVGGYELHCARVADWLALNGVETRVLTGDYRREGAASNDEMSASDGRSGGVAGPRVFRELRLRYWTDVADLGYWTRDWRDLRTFRQHMRDFNPDLVVLWNMRKLASGMALEAQRMAPALAYHLMDEWMAEFPGANGLPQFWARPAKSVWGRLFKPMLRTAHRLTFTPDLSSWRPKNAVFVSKALRDLTEKRGVHVPNTLVSYITYDPALFSTIDWNRSNDPESPVRFLWAGRLCRGKGLATTFDALDLLTRRMPEGWSADFCGPIDEEEDSAWIHRRLTESAWKGRARWLGALPHAEMPRQYRDHDVFLFTSEVHEGLPGTIIEAFAAGLPVIGTLTGGTRDVLVPGENCLVYPMGDATALAEAMEQLAKNPTERRRLAAKTREFAQRECSGDQVFPRLLEFYRTLKK
jgi:glycosyltransferase involved in cell wall biosynthesis